MMSWLDGQGHLSLKFLTPESKGKAMESMNPWLQLIPWTPAHAFAATYPCVFSAHRKMNSEQKWREPPVCWVVLQECTVTFTLTTGRKWRSHLLLFTVRSNFKGGALQKTQLLVKVHVIECPSCSQQLEVECQVWWASSEQVPNVECLFSRLLLLLFVHACVYELVHTCSACFYVYEDMLARVSMCGDLKLNWGVFL